MKQIPGKMPLFNRFKGHTTIIVGKNKKHYKKHTCKQTKAYLYSFLLVSKYNLVYSSKYKNSQLSSNFKLLLTMSISSFLKLFNMS